MPPSTVGIVKKYGRLRNVILISNTLPCKLYKRRHEIIFIVIGKGGQRIQDNFSSTCNFTAISIPSKVNHRRCHGGKIREHAHNDFTHNVYSNDLHTN